MASSDTRMARRRLVGQVRILRRMRQNCTVVTWGRSIGCEFGGVSNRCLFDGDGMERHLSPWIPPWQFLLCKEREDAPSLREAETKVSNGTTGATLSLRGMHAISEAYHARVPPSVDPLPDAIPTLVHEIQRSNSSNSDGSNSSWESTLKGETKERRVLPLERLDSSSCPRCCEPSDAESCDRTGRRGL